MFLPYQISFLEKNFKDCYFPREVVIQLIEQEEETATSRFMKKYSNRLEVECKPLSKDSFQMDLFYTNSNSDGLSSF